MNAPPAARLPAFGVVAPFFVGAPLGLLVAGLILAQAGEEVFLAPTVPDLIAATHAAVLGWLSLAMMGAFYQLGPATLGGRVKHPLVAQLQFWLHATAVLTFVFAVREWNVTWMSVAGVGIALSFIVFIVNAVAAIGWSLRGPATRQYFSVALFFLALVGAVGVTYVGTIQHAWFPLTQGRAAGHAHVGLVGWLALVIMGSSYRLVPMFQLSHSRPPRLATPALLVTASAAGFGSLILMGDPGPQQRLAVGLAFILGPVLWAVDMWRMILGRGRRVADSQLKATILSLVFLPLAMALGLAAAAGHEFGPVTPARFQLAYGIVAIAGWAGTTLVGNGFKIVPFLVWYSRYRRRAGREDVPLVSDLTNPRLLDALLAWHAAGVVTLAAAALAANLELFHLGGMLIAGSGAATFGALVAVVVRHPTPPSLRSVAAGGTASP